MINVLFFFSFRILENARDLFDFGTAFEEDHGGWIGERGVHVTFHQPASTQDLSCASFNQAPPAPDMYVWHTRIQISPDPSLVMGMWVCLRWYWRCRVSVSVHVAAVGMAALQVWLGFGVWEMERWGEVGYGMS